MFYREGNLPAGGGKGVWIKVSPKCGLAWLYSRDAFLGGLPTLRDGRGRAGTCKKNAQILNIARTDAVYYLTWI
jgi:hypothetical protein